MKLNKEHKLCLNNVKRSGYCKEQRGIYTRQTKLLHVHGETYTSYTKNKCIRTFVSMQILGFFSELYVKEEVLLAVHVLCQYT